VRDWEGDVNPASRLQAPELSGRDAHDGKDAIPMPQRLADGTFRTAESSLCVTESDDSDRWIQLFVPYGEQPAGAWRDPEQLEVVAGGDLSEDLLDGAVDFDFQVISRVGCHAGERRRVVTQAIEAGIRRRSIGALRACRLNKDELVWPLYRQRTQ